MGLLEPRAVCLVPESVGDATEDVSAKTMPTRLGHGGLAQQKFTLDLDGHIEIIHTTCIS